MEEPRLILYHKQSTSAHLRFLHFPRSVLAFSPVPMPARLCENAHIAHSIRPHPGAWAARACHTLGLAHDALEGQGSFYEEVRHAELSYPILLARFTAVDPPMALATQWQGRFATLSDLRDINRLELELLGRAYEFIIG